MTFLGSVGIAQNNGKLIIAVIAHNQRWDESSDPGFEGLLRDVLGPTVVSLVVTIVNGKVESVCSVDLDVYQAWTIDSRSALPIGSIVVSRGIQPENVATQVQDFLWPLFLPVKCVLSIQNDALSFINPKVLLYQLSVFLTEETIREAD